jgi:tetratricopeptide (TPR) repeat protein
MSSKRVVILAFFFIIAGLPLAYAAEPALPEETLPITTRSAQARHVFDKGLARFQSDLRVETAVNTWKLAVKKDPNFALAHGFIAFVSRDPNEQAIHRQAALGLSKKVTKGEQLLIAWMADAGDGHFLDAIADMNQLLGLYPHDQNLTWFAGWWLMRQNEDEKAIPFFERTTNFPGSWNELAYCYAARHDWEKMLAAARKYMELAPKEPNPHDSLAELSRVMGKFEDAFSEYRIALQLDPTFSSAQLGIADTYALTGGQVRARVEYDKAIKMAPTEAQAADWALQSAATYVREKDFDGADKAFRAVASQTRVKGLGELEAEAYRQMALYQKDPKAAMELLSKAADVLKENKGMSKASREQEMAVVLYARVLRDLDAGNKEEAKASVAELNHLATSSRRTTILHAYYSAHGAVLAAEGNWDNAVQDLEEDDRDPFALRTLVLAYQKLGKMEESNRVAEVLSNLNRPTLEQALIVPAFRLQRQGEQRSHLGNSGPEIADNASRRIN